MTEADLRVSWVVFSQGEHPRALRQATSSLFAQSPPPHEVIVVVGGAVEDHRHPGTPRGASGLEAEPFRDPVVVVDPIDPLSFGDGLNAGVAAATGELIGLLDEQSVLLHAEVQASVVEVFQRDPLLAALTLRDVDYGSLANVSSEASPAVERPSTATLATSSFDAGAGVIRRAAVRSVDGFWGSSGCKDREHVVDDMAWRLIDAGWILRRTADICVLDKGQGFTTEWACANDAGRARALLARRLWPFPVAVFRIGRLWLGAAVHRRYPHDGYRRGLWSGLTGAPPQRHRLRLRTILGIRRRQ